MDNLKISSILKFSFFYAVIVIGICLLFFRDFFSIDDALNESLGFQTQFGKIWLSGHVPFIVPDLWIGGNGMVELDRGIFLPQIIIASILAYSFDSIRLPGIFLALVNLSVLAFSGVILAKKIGLRDIYAYVFSAFIVISPVFLYQYSGGWWNGAAGQAWATAAIASFLALRCNTNKLNIVVNFICVVMLMNTGWPHAIVGYAVFVLITLTHQLIHTKQIKPILWLAVPSVLALLCCVPIYSEYVFSGNLINRPSGFYNDGRFLSPAWSSMIMGFFPAYYEYMHYFGGYRLMLVPFGFSSLFLLSVFFYRKTAVLWRQDSTLKWLLALGVVFFLLTQMPSQFGPLRWSFRFLPFLSMVLCLLTFYVLDKAPRVYGRMWGYVLAVALSGLLAVMTGLGTETQIKHIGLQLLSMGLLLAVPWLLHKRNTGLMVSSALLCLLIMLAGVKSLGYKERFVLFAKLPHTIHISQDINRDGFVLSLTNHANRTYINDLNSAQFGVYNIKSINGYAPVGNKALDEMLPHDTAHAFFKPNETLGNVLQAPRLSSACQAELMRISTILLPDVDYEQHKQALTACGYTQVQALPNGDVGVSLSKSQTVGWASNPPSVWPQGLAGSVQMVTHQNNTDVVDLLSATQARTLIFPRVWWPGYAATINGKALPVGHDTTGTLVQITVPAHVSGRLKLSYFPYTWHFVWPLPVLAVSGLIGLVWWRRKISRLMDATNVAA